jgi:hypothetical protein
VFTKDVYSATINNMTTRNLELGDTVYFVDDVSIPGGIKPDGELRQAVVTDIMDNTVQLGIIDGQNPDQARELVQRSPDDVMTADDVLETTFQVGATEALSALKVAIARH